VFGSSRSTVDLDVELERTDAAMDIIQRRREGFTVLALRGRLGVSPDESEIRPFRAIVDGLIAEGRVTVALDLSALLSIDARGLGELAFTLVRLRKRGGDLTLLAPSASLRKLLAVTRLDTVFRTDADLSEVPGRAHRGPPPVDSGWSIDRLGPREEFLLVHAE